MPGQIRPTSRIGCKSIEIDAGCIGCKSIEIDAGQMPLTGNVISMDLHLNSTGKIQPVKLGVNPLRSKAFNRQWITLHAWSNLVIVISMDLHPIRPVEFGVNPLR